MAPKFALNRAGTEVMLSSMASMPLIFYVLIWKRPGMVDIERFFFWIEPMGVNSEMILQSVFFLAIFSAILFICSAVLVRRHLFWAKRLATLSLSGTALVTLPALVQTPFAALIGSTLFIYGLFFLSDLGRKLHGDQMRSVPDRRLSTESEKSLWQELLAHPARMLLITFLSLSAVGTLLLMLPMSVTHEIAWVDAAFTAFSAVCVTGLIVLDTPVDFTMTGQGFILILIQLGGLGIMGITTVAIHAMGRRLSLRQERALTAITDTNHHDLLRSFGLILKYTLIIELFGGLLLTGLFHMEGNGGSWSRCAWQGFFTSISAFCNAGFALQSDSLISWRQTPMILHTVALLIILGGIAPATVMMVWGKLHLNRRITAAGKITLMTTVALLGLGFFFFLSCEWDGILAGLPLADKVHNAWFLAVTLRTAGFNSVDLVGTGGPAFLVMLLSMFIGGSPGGTAGGIKTTTMGVLCMTFWSNIRSRDEVTVGRRVITAGTVYRAVTVVLAGAFVWFLTVFMLEITQEISMRSIVFEATSAIATVGLSIGATGQLDEIGKVIVIGAMFLGRIGPITLFMLLSDERSITRFGYLEAKISLT